MTEKYWDDYAQEKVESIFKWAETYTGNGDLVSMRLVMDSMIQNFFYDNVALERECEPYWLNLGAMASKADYPSISVQTISNTLSKKQNDYGPQNIARFGTRGLVVRVHDKVARLENLLYSGKTANNESIEDTYIDIIGYSAIGLMWIDNQFLTPLKPR